MIFLRKYFFRIFFILIFFIFPLGLFAQNNKEELPKLIFFHSLSCHKCIKVKNKFMPGLKERFKDKIQIDYRDIGDIENYKLMLGLKEQCSVSTLKELPIIFFAEHFLSGEDQIEKELVPLIESVIKKSPPKEKVDLAFDLISYFRSFTPLTVTGAGLLDGINPCAFTVIVFFISFLVLQGYPRRELIAVGLFFIFAVFLTYVLIGIGLFGFLYHLKGFWLVSKILNFSIGIFSITLGIFALYDFFKFRKTKDTEGLILQLPGRLKQEIHKVIGWYYRKPKGQEENLKVGLLRLVMSALICGFLVSILEAVCTGQVYLPTISFVLKTTPLKLEALGYLLLYNLMFIVPLLIIFCFALWGVTSQAFARFLKKHLLTVKILMAVLFFSLGIFLVWRA